MYTEFFYEVPSSNVMNKKDFGRLERIDQISEKHTHFISRFGSLLMFRAWLFVACT
ncbi:hypothetical protein V6Z11_A07G071100 [Gossypium hirsutum]